MRACHAGKQQEAGLRAVCVGNVRYLDGMQGSGPGVGRTTAYVTGGITEEKSRQHPGIEPVWVQWLVLAGIIVVSSADLVILDQLASNGGRP